EIGKAAKRCGDSFSDYHNARPGYLEHFWALVNWEFVAKNLAA
ncbi:Fe-Mn family superoxide dismutase, partial [Escherichia sp. HC-CC]